MDHGPWTGPIRWPELEPSNLKPSNEPSEAATLYRSQFIFRSTSIQCKVCAFRISHLYMYLYLYLYTDICVSVCRGILSMPSPSLSQSRSFRQSLDSTKWRKKKRNKIKRKSINAKIPKETILMVKVQQSQPHSRTSNIHYHHPSSAASQDRAAIQRPRCVDEQYLMWIISGRVPYKRKARGEAPACRCVRKFCRWERQYLTDTHTRLQRWRYRCS